MSIVEKSQGYVSEREEEEVEEVCVKAMFNVE